MGKYAPLLGKLRLLLEAGGASMQELDDIAAEACLVAEGVFRPVDVIRANGYGDNLDDATDLMLIGAIVARYGMVMGNPFAGKE